MKQPKRKVIIHDATFFYSLERWWHECYKPDRANEVNYGALSGAFGHCTRCDYALDLAQWLAVCAAIAATPPPYLAIMFPVVVL